MYLPPWFVIVLANERVLPLWIRLMTMLRDWSHGFV